MIMSSKKGVNNGNRASSSSTKTSSSSSTKSSAGKSVFVSLNEDKIRERAFMLSQQSKNWNDLVWSVAEADLKLSLAIPKDVSPLAGNVVKEVKIDVAKLIPKPKQDDVRKMAEMVANHHPSLQELHWNLALREVLLDSVNKVL
jgi:hypothetical protein